MHRRSFLHRFAGWGAIAVAAASGMGLLASIFPRQPRNRDVCRVGRAEEYPYDTFTYIPRHGIFVHRSPGGVRALSARCTHLGCAVLPGDDGFLCPCHGSRFDARGRVIGGAAQRDLPWLRVSRAADGMLVVHMAERVSAETILAG